MAGVVGTKQKLSKVSDGRMGNNHGNDVALVGILRGCGHSQGRKEPLLVLVVSETIYSQTTLVGEARKQIRKRN